MGVDRGAESVWKGPQCEGSWSPTLASPDGAPEYIPTLAKPGWGTRSY